MKKFLILTMLLAVCGMTYAQGANAYHELTVVDENNNRYVNADITSIRVLIAGTNTNATIYTTKSNSTAITQPITPSSTNTTLVGSNVYWWGANLYDIVVVTTGGNQVIRRGDNNSIGSIVVQAGKISTPENIYIDFNSQPVCVQEDGTVASGVDTEIDVMAVDGGWIMEYYNIGTQTVLVPNIVATGLDISRTGTNDIGTEYGFGVLANQPGGFVVGTSPAFFMRAKITITDVSGTDDFGIGFRKSEAYQSAQDSYDEMAAFNIISGDVNLKQILNGTTTTTDTTNNWADLATKTVQVNVSSAGVTTYLIDGVAPTTVAAFTFDDAEVVVPFISLLNAADVAESTVLWELTVGLQ